MYSTHSAANGARFQLLSQDITIVESRHYKMRTYIAHALLCCSHTTEDLCRLRLVPLQQQFKQLCPTLTQCTALLKSVQHISKSVVHSPGQPGIILGFSLN